MESLGNIISALTASSVAMIIGAIIREVEWPSLLLQPGSEIFVSPIVGDGPWWSLTAFLFAVGAVIGALFAGPALVKRFDKRLGMAFFDAVLNIGLFAITFPFESTALIVAGRLILGIGSGALSAIVPAYVGEISEPKIRGRSSVLFPAIMVMGVVISYAFGPFKQYNHQQPFDVSFNVYCFLIVMLHAIGLCFIPKLPHSSSNNFFGQRHDNEYSAINLLGEPQWTEILFPEFETDNYNNASRRSSWYYNTLDAFDSDSDRRALLIGVGCMFFHQICGKNIILSYMIHIMKISEIHIDSKTVFITLGIIQIFMMGVAIIIIDNKGRRILLISSAVIMCLCLAGLAFCIIFKTQLNTSTFGNLSMILIMIFILAYSLGFGPVPWVIMGEIFSTKVKPYGISFATAINWLMVLASVYFPYEMNKFFSVEHFFLFHSVLCLFGALFAWRIVPETKKINLPQIQWEISATLEFAPYVYI
ncbi:facilitated trehalose transporter Tret1-2 homolog [Aphis gossypii]|uniref:facilitated trehalose transporter Tret1-2 homolog n=1 Tax=Aphis gossypii TaxID=80765 RepID=UPI0021595067|nr:facilitated trehalose transporter Tret1-2 homolog [Aphis gossypii]